MAKRQAASPRERGQHLSGLGDVDYEAVERAQRELIGPGTGQRPICLPAPPVDDLDASDPSDTDHQP